MKKVLFVLHLDKFTYGFYKFIVSCFNQQENWFLIYGKMHEFDFNTKDERVFWCDTYRELNKSHPIKKIVGEFDLILYSGLFGSENCLRKFGLKTLSKSYFHFWGGDFYEFRNFKNECFRHRIILFFKRYLINHVAGVITLIPNDYEELNKLCNPKGKHFVAPMCDNGENTDIIDSLKNVKKSIMPIKILLGNSATESNQHIQAMLLLEKFKDKDINIICPLSYGNAQYREQVIEKGKEIFSDKFIPITDYMKKSDYFRIIAECSIAIFNNNRQQAMGNINAALALGCKVFIRSDTSMWERYHYDRNMVIYDVGSISDLSFEEFTYTSPGQLENYQKYRDYIRDDLNIKAWQCIFDSIGSGDICHEQ